MKKLLAFLLSMVCVPVFSVTVTVNLKDGTPLSKKLRADMDSLVLKGSFMYEDFATLRDYINNGNLRGIDMSEVDNVTYIPVGAFAPTSVNSSSDMTKESSDTKFITKLEYIKLPRILREICGRAFFKTRLRSIDLPKLTRIGSEAFSDCQDLKSVTFHQADVPDVTDGHAFDNIPADATLNVPLGMAEKFRSSADFSNFTTIRENGSLFVIKEFNLDENSRPLEELLGDDMLNVDSVRITGYLKHSDIKPLRLGACYGRLSGIDLSGCRIENDVLPDMAFVSHMEPPYSPSEPYLYANAQNLRYFSFPEGLKSTGGNTFMGARFLPLEFPATLDRIESYAFCDGEIYGNLVIPEGVTWLGRQAFDSNAIKGDVYLPSTLKYVDTNALGIIMNGNRNSGKNFYYNRMTPPIQKDVVSYYSPLISSHYMGDRLLENSNWTLYVPVGAKAAFAADEKWGKFPNIIETPKLDGGTSGISSAVAVDGQTAEKRIYTLDGRYVGTDMGRLGSGVYLVGGKKVIK